MRKLVLAVMGLAVASISLNSQAVLYTDVYAPDTRVGSDSWTFDITDDGFDFNLEDVISATITLSVSDDNNRMNDPSESGELSTNDGDVFAVAITNQNTTPTDVTFILTSYASLDNDGTLGAALTALTGDFDFYSATLNVETVVSAVPVPAAVWLFGTGLVGLVGVARRKKA